MKTFHNRFLPELRLYFLEVIHFWERPINMKLCLFSLEERSTLIIGFSSMPNEDYAFIALKLSFFSSYDDNQQSALRPFPVHWNTGIQPSLSIIISFTPRGGGGGGGRWHFPSEFPSMSNAGGTAPCLLIQLPHTLSYLISLPGAIATGKRNHHRPRSYN